MKPDVEPELGAREEEGVFHGSPGPRDGILVSLVRLNMTQVTQQSPAAPDASQSSSRGKLKIFFGAFPGAGKTNAMLTAAQRVRAAIDQANASPSTKTLAQIKAMAASLDKDANAVKTSVDANRMRALAAIMKKGGGSAP